MLSKQCKCGQLRGWLPHPLDYLPFHSLSRGRAAKERIGGKGVIPGYDGGTRRICAAASRSEKPGSDTA